MNNYLYGLRKGLPIALGYFAVAFAFGVTCTAKGFSPILSTILSLTNLTSAGQYAGVNMILSKASYFEIGITVLLINLRYSLMSISLAQKMDSSIPTWKRLLFGFGISDEIFAIAITEKKELTASYMFGLITLPIIGWTLGTATGAFLADLFPDRVLLALEIALYAMFIAIIIPDTKKSKPVLYVVLLSIIISCIFYYVPYINNLNYGFKIIITTVISSLIIAFFFPIEDEKNYTLNEVKEECNDAL